MRIPVAPAARASLTVLRMHAFAWVIVVLALQGVIALVVLPALSYLFRFVLATAGIDGINQQSLLLILGEPAALIVLLGYAVIATACIVFQVATIAAIGNALCDGRDLTLTTALAALRPALRTLVSRQSPILALYAVLILPLAHLGLSSSLTAHVAIPRFISGELAKTPVGFAAYWLLIAVIVYLAFRLLATMAVLTRGDHTVIAAMRASFATTRPVQVRLAAILLCVGAAVVVVVTIPALLGALPIALVPDEAAAAVTGVTLAIVSAVRFLAIGFATVFMTLLLVVLARQRDGLPIAVGARRSVGNHGVRHHSAPTGTRVFAVIVATAGLFAVVAQSASLALSAPAVAAGDRTLIVAHRGNTAEAVENSIEALRAAAEAGADMVELDVQETKDGGLVVVHDTDLRRLTGVDAKVFDLTTDEVTALTTQQGEHTSRVPTFDAFAAEARALGMPLLVEVKPHGHEANGFAERVAAAVSASDPERVDWVQSLDAGVLAAIEQADPERHTAIVVGLQLGDLPGTSAESIVIEDWSYADAMLATAHVRGQTLLVWTVNESESIRQYLARGVDGVITDSVASAVTARTLHEEITNPVSTYLVRILPLLRP